MNRKLIVVLLAVVFAVAIIIFATSRSEAHGDHICPRSTIGPEGGVVELDISDALTQTYVDGDLTVVLYFNQNLEVSTEADWPIGFMSGKIEYESMWVEPWGDVIVEDQPFWNGCPLSGPNWNILTTGIYCTSGTDIDSKLTWTISNISQNCESEWQHEFQNIEGATDSTRKWSRMVEISFAIVPDLEDSTASGYPEDFCTSFYTPCSGVGPSFTHTQSGGPHGNQQNMLFQWGSSDECDESGGGHDPSDGGYIRPYDIHVNWNSNTTSYTGGDCYYIEYDPSIVKCQQANPCTCCVVTESKATRTVTQETDWGAVKFIYRKD